MGTVDQTYLPHEFAKRAGVTIRALHHYDRLGLLKPSGRTGSGYRVYTDRDFARLEQIVALKFIGFPLSQIRDLLRRKDIDLSAALRQQRDILAEKKHHLERAMHAIENAERIVSAGGDPDWEPFRKVIEVIQMQTRKDWMKKYYTEEQLAGLRKRWTPEVQAESERGWAALVRDTESAIARRVDPGSETGQKLAERRAALVALFTGGDPGMEENLQKLSADKANWPANFKKPLSDAVDKFLCDAVAELAKVKA
ncbi:MAG: MerR family transcriptional regulator [Candidatus Sulfotelmatobacter sp.]|jgi:MerR family transcriptional regulator, thiopeptide resistance regulator